MLYVSLTEYGSHRKLRASQVCWIDLQSAIPCVEFEGGCSSSSAFKVYYS